MELIFLITLLCNLAPWVYRFVSRQRRLPSEIDEVVLKLEKLHLHVKAAELVKHRDSRVQAWVGEVRGVVHQIEDIIEEFKLGGGILSNNSLALKLKEFKPKFDRICDAPLVETPLSKALRLKDEQSVLWAPVARSGGSSHHRADEFTCVDPVDLEGIEEHVDTLRTWMAVEPSPVNGHVDARTRSIAICGMAGVGKTTLISSVFHRREIRKEFDFCAWVCVSEAYHQLGLLKSLLKRLSADGAQGSLNSIIHGLNREDLVYNIRNMLNEKRYLIVFDDVWDSNFWSEISRVLPKYTKGSRILLTTRSQDVARSLARDSRILMLKPLAEEKALSLFCRKAFGEEEKARPDLDWVRKIVRRCSGLPLAIVVIGSLLSTRDTDALTWKQSFDSLYYEFLSQDSIKDVVMLSLYCLPCYLKFCFLYCSMFPEDYPIGRKLLIRLWIAEGFIEPQEGATLEQVAEKYLRDLVHRNLIQVVETNEAGRIRVCKLHDVVREIALKVSEEEEISTTHLNGVLARRLSIHQQHDDRTIHARASGLSKLRSLLVFARDDRMASELGKPLNLRLLRVLDLRGVPIKKVPEVVFRLCNLKYLSLRETKVEYQTFPKEVQNLRQLQTLDLWKTYVKALPPEVGYLHDLRHVMICDASDTTAYCALPRSIQNLTNLQTLKSFKASDPKLDYTNLKNLTQLRTLSISDVSNADGLRLCSSIIHMGNLLRLKVKSKNGHFVPLQYLDPPPPYLQKLQLNGQLRSIPQWFRSLRSLTHLYLFDSKVPDKTIVEYVESLPSLVFLCLDNAYDGESLSFRRGVFSSLRTLYLQQLPFLRSVDIDKGALPGLRKLYMIECRSLRAVPRVEEVRSLQELVVHDCDPTMVGGLQKICEYLENVKMICR